MARIMAALDSLSFAPNGPGNTPEISESQKSSETSFRERMVVFPISCHL